MIAKHLPKTSYTDSWNMVIIENVCVYKTIAPEVDPEISIQIEGIAGLK